jgi:hypothetical protein
MAITQDKSRGIFWQAIKSALAITSQDPADLAKYFDTQYSKLFDGWTSNLGDADSKIAAALFMKYKEKGYTVNDTPQGFMNMSKAVRTSTDADKNTINTYFNYVNGKILG